MNDFLVWPVVLVVAGVAIALVVTWLRRPSSTPEPPKSGLRVTEPGASGIVGPLERIWMSTIEGDRLAELREIGAHFEGDGLAELVGVFRRKTPEQLTGLSEALKNDDLGEVLRLAGDLRDDTDYLGAQKMAFVCKSIEEAAEQGKRERLELFLGFLNVAYERAMRTLTAETKSKG
jgi:HPt (histidine-containing phosphotransfer) domain-containing protein